MAVRIRLARHGKKKAPFYRLVVADSRSPRDGRFIELIGTYNPMTDPADVKVNEERALHWLTVGAIPSNTARALLRKSGVMDKLPSAKKGKPENQEAPAVCEIPDTE
ncbi:MAG: 30S ribosomal protein S16 [Synergistaceae bacterium]|jgi:small subunit ribosomal protein S16|nr:30S ribosomal protein S16 [Synergistaceae bacterium]